MEIGDKVIDTRWDSVGYIQAIFPSCLDVFEGDASRMQNWLDQQLIPFSDSELSENWYRVMCVGGGAIFSCASNLEKIDGVKAIFSEQ